MNDDDLNDLEKQADLALELDMDVRVDSIVLRELVQAVRSNPVRLNLAELEPGKRKLIAIDYDHTFTTDIVLWLMIYRMLTRRGHDVLIATMRHEHEKKSMDARVVAAVPQIIFTGRRAKKYALAALGIHPDIWVDDTPEFLFINAAIKE